MKKTKKSNTYEMVPVVKSTSQTDLEQQIQTSNIQPEETIELIRLTPSLPNVRNEIANSNEGELKILKCSVKSCLVTTSLFVAGIVIIASLASFFYFSWKTGIDKVSLQETWKELTLKIGIGMAVIIAILGSIGLLIASIILLTTGISLFFCS